MFFAVSFPFRGSSLPRINHNVLNFANPRDVGKNGCPPTYPAKYIAIREIALL